MILTEKKQYDRDYVLADEGLHQAVCVDQFEGVTEFINRETGERLSEDAVAAAGIKLVDGVWIGIPDEVKQRNTIWLGFELDQLTPEGDKPLSIRKKFTASIHERATLRIFMERWRGRPFTAAEKQAFETENLVGVPCQLNIVHRDFGSGPRQLVDFAIREDGAALKPSGKYVRNKDREPQRVEGIQPANGSAENGPADSGLPSENPPF
jgi:hypothetical protein